MPFTRLSFLFLLSVFVSGPTLAEEGIGGLDLYFTQKGEPLRAAKTENYYFRLRLAKAPFEIHYGAQEIGVCVSPRPAVFEKANIATDTKSDFTSCMFIYKDFVMSADGGVLIANINGSNWLNQAHGARKEQNNRYIYPVTRFTGKESSGLELNRIMRPMYLVFWDDLDKNKTIDLGEVARVELVFK